MKFSSLQREQLSSLKNRQDELRLSADAKLRIEWLLYFVEHERSISKTCSYFHIARTTLQRWLTRFDPENPFSLEERSHRAVQLKKPLVSQYIIQTLAQYRRAYPHVDKQEILQMLAREQGLRISQQEYDYAIIQMDLLPISFVSQYPIVPPPQPSACLHCATHAAAPPMATVAQNVTIVPDVTPVPAPVVDVSTSTPEVKTPASFAVDSKAATYIELAQYLIHKMGIALSLIAIGWLMASYQLATFARDVQTQAHDVPTQFSDAADRSSSDSSTQ